MEGGSPTSASIYCDVGASHSPSSQRQVAQDDSVSHCSAPIHTATVKESVNQFKNGHKGCLFCNGMKNIQHVFCFVLFFLSVCFFSAIGHHGQVILSTRLFLKGEGGNRGVTGTGLRAPPPPLSYPPALYLPTVLILCRRKLLSSFISAWFLETSTLKFIRTTLNNSLKKTLHSHKNTSEFVTWSIDF